MRAFAFLLIALAMAACSANPDKQVVREAATAMTGSPETVTAVNTLVLDGRGDAYQPESKIAAFHESYNFRRRQWRMDMTRFDSSATPQFGVQAFDRRTAFDEGPSGSPRPADTSEAELRRAELYHHPVGFLFAALLRGSKLSNPRREAESESIDLTVENTVYTLSINSADKLPIRIASRTSRGQLIETFFSDYRKMQGYRMPARFERKMDGKTVFTLEAPRQYAGADLDLSARELARN